MTRSRSCVHKFLPPGSGLDRSKCAGLWCCCPDRRISEKCRIFVEKNRLIADGVKFLFNGPCSFNRCHKPSPERLLRDNKIPSRTTASGYSCFGRCTMEHRGFEPVSSEPREEPQWSKEWARWHSVNQPLGVSPWFNQHMTHTEKSKPKQPDANALRLITSAG